MVGRPEDGETFESWRGIADKVGSAPIATFLPIQFANNRHRRFTRRKRESRTLFA